MTVGELIENLKATEEMDKEILIEVNGERYTIVNKLFNKANSLYINILEIQYFKQKV